MVWKSTYRRDTSSLERERRNDVFGQREAVAGRHPRLLAVTSVAAGGGVVQRPKNSPEYYMKYKITSPGSNIWLDMTHWFVKLIAQSTSTYPKENLSNEALTGWHFKNDGIRNRMEYGRKRFLLWYLGRFNLYECLWWLSLSWWWGWGDGR